MKLTKPSYTITFTPEQIGVIHAALMELPAKHSMSIVESLVQQVIRQENPTPVAVDPQPAEIVDRIMGA